MPVAPTPREIYERSIVEGQRRLRASTVELLATGFNAGFTIVFGIAAFGAITGLLEPALGAGVARLGGGLGFGIGLMFLVVTRAELFTENFFDPVATVVRDHRGRRGVVDLGRLWALVLVLNLVGGALLALVMSLGSVLPASAAPTLQREALDIVDKSAGALFASALVGGALVTLLSFMLQAVDRVLSQMIVALAVGFLLAITPLAHSVVTALHLLMGRLEGGDVALPTAAAATATVVLGNVVGGLAFVTLSHITQAAGDGRTET